MNPDKRDSCLLARVRSQVVDLLVIGLPDCRLAGVVAELGSTDCRETSRRMLGNAPALEMEQLRCAFGRGTPALFTMSGPMTAGILAPSQPPRLRGTARRLNSVVEDWRFAKEDAAQVATVIEALMNAGTFPTQPAALQSRACPALFDGVAQDLGDGLLVDSLQGLDLAQQLGVLPRVVNFELLERHGE